MLSQSAMMNSAQQARFRVQAPNSTPRAVTVIALDATSDAVIRQLASVEWQHARFLTTLRRDDDAGMLHDLAGHDQAVDAEVEAADLIVLVAGPGGVAHAGSVIGEACSCRGVMTTGFVVGVASAPADALSATLAQLRPWSLMVVVARNDDYLDDMMTALRA